MKEKAAECTLGEGPVAVIFEVMPTAAGTKGYFDAAAMLRDFLAKTPGFISVERFESVSAKGRFLSLSFWKNEKAAELWRNQMQHRACQKTGRENLFKDFRISVGRIVRSYTLTDRAQAPEDSKKALGS